MESPPKPQYVLASAISQAVNEMRAASYISTLKVIAPPATARESSKK